MPKPSRSHLALCALVALGTTDCRGLHLRRGRPAGVSARVTPLAAHRASAHAYGRRGDLVLSSSRGDGPSLTVSTAPDQPGHRPLRGAVLDASHQGGDRPDPLLWWRPAWIDAQDRAHPLVATTVTQTRCADGSPGVRTEGTVDGVTLEHTLCVASAGRFTAYTRARGPLPDGATLGDELAPGTSNVATDTDGEAWEERTQGHTLAVAERGTALALTRSYQSPTGPAPAPMIVYRRLIRIAAEVFRDALRVRYPGASTQVTRTLHVGAGGVLDAFALARTPSRTLRLQLANPSGGTVVLRDEAGHQRFEAEIPAETRTPSIAIPRLFTGSLVMKDEEGIPSAPLRLDDNAFARPWSVPYAPRGTISVHVIEAGGPVPVHVMVRGAQGTPDADVHFFGTNDDGTALRGLASGFSAYLLDGRGSLRVPPGHYDVAVTRGPQYTGFGRSITVDPNGGARVEGEISRVVPAEGYVSADLHLHAEPSPDSRVSLQDRVTSLVCEGVELAVATDHNRVTDYGPAVAALRVRGRITVLPGNEVTSAGRNLFGHFNAYPWPEAPAGESPAPEDRVSAYYGVSPREIFTAARAAGAPIVQVNHPRMPPAIGYFDQTHLDARTGIADADFSTDFDAVEAFNGMWMETPERIREGARDLVGLARRGLHVAATGNSDSHHLTFEEPGWPRTYVRVDPGLFAAAPGQALADGLRRGQTTVSAGPFVELWVENEGPGATVTARQGRVHVRVRVSAPSWVAVDRVSLWVDDRPQALPVTPTLANGVRAEYEMDLPVTRDVVLLAWAEGDRPLAGALPYPNARPVGFTGLVYVDADANGAVNLAPGEREGAAEPTRP